MRVHNSSPQQVNYYGAFAYTSVILTCFAGSFLYTRNIGGHPWQVVVTFLLGAAYGAIAILDNGFAVRFGETWRVRLYFLNCAIATAMLFVSPVRGYFGIIVMPLLAQAIIDFRPLVAWLVGLGLFAITIGVFGFYFGAGAMFEAMLSYVTAFAFTGVFTTITKGAVTARNRAEELRHELEEVNRQLREHAAQAEELATTRERNRLAREIHDGVGHYLTVVKTQLDAAAALIATQPEQARVTVEKAAKLAHEALEDVRRSVGTLRTDAVRPPLADSLRQLAVHAEPAPELHITGTPRELSAAAEHTLFRATQEALTNIRKHARATAASVTLDFREPARVRLTVTDNGRGSSGGINLCGLNGGGYGLRGLRERVEIIGGKLETGPLTGGGFTLSVEVPA
ncbi:MAG TPA: sensor histidine kinase [Candidatus Didemnitutus sp.]|nr:sensor histidine kinase [Candidatus Didemnitutus sp.]